MSADLTLKLKAIDEASATLQTVGDNSAAAFTKAADSAEKTGMSFSEVATKASNLANVGFNLYNSYDRIGDAQLRVEKAAVTLRSAVDSERTAQMTLNRAVEKYGEDSDQAVAAKEMLITASERVRISEMQLEENQSRVNDAMMQGSIQAIPAVIGGYGTLNEMMGDKGLAGTFTTALPKMSSAFSAFGSTMMAHPIILIIAAIVVAITLLYAAWQSNFGGIREITAGAFDFLKGVFEGFLGFGGRVVDFFKGLGGVIQSALKGVLNIYIGIMNIAIDGINLLIKAYNSTIGLIPGVAKIGELPKITPLKTGGIVTNPTLALLGEAGPEAVVPLNRGLSGGVNITLVVEGSADRKTIDYAKREIWRELRSVIQENTSASAATKRIRRR